MAAAEESIRGKTRPDMSRNEGLAGQTVTDWLMEAVQEKL